MNSINAMFRNSTYSKFRNSTFSNFESQPFLNFEIQRFRFSKMSNPQIGSSSFPDRLEQQGLL